MASLKAVGRLGGRKLNQRWRRAGVFYAMMLPALAILVLYKYIPMGGLIIAFKDFRITRGILDSAWNGLTNITKFFNSPFFGMIIRNTILISLYKIIFAFPAPIILALMLNEVKQTGAKRLFQTAYYLPHFISWVVIGNLLFVFFAPSSGAFSTAFYQLTGIKFNPLMNAGGFRAFLVITDIWKEVGWSSIIYLAAITSIDPTLYEAAIIDGARKHQLVWHVTVAGIMPTIVTMLLMRVGHILNAGFEQIFILQNSVVYEVSEILDTYTYKVSFEQGQYVIGAVAGLFKSVIGLTMVLTVNKIAARYEQDVL